METSEKGPILACIEREGGAHHEGGQRLMPGCDADLEDILRALKSGALTRKELARNASRVYHSKCKRNNERNRR